ncbi:MAG TPA: sensor domain-containing diguanylate cyclase [Solirubrobacteraceae bacterium]|nr:sensor domain-containing diguanylate cyclase [Solirubrobacteraceae bacterium]
MNADARVDRRDPEEDPPQSGVDERAALRAAAVRRLELVDRLRTPALAGLTRLAAHLTGASGAAVHIFDDDTQHRVAGAGAPLGEHPAADSMCAAVVDAERRVVCTDATLDGRFGYSSSVHGDRPVRFYASVPIRSRGGITVGTVCAFDEQPRQLSEEQLTLLEDLARQVELQVELAELAGALREAAAHDPLTGALNRAMLNDRLGQALARRSRRQTKVLVIVADVNDLKTANDRHGHARGDEILRSVVARLRAVTRAEDSVARLGGDEFGVVAELFEHDDPGPVLERIQRALHASGTPAIPSLSLGAVIAHPDDDVRAALRRADQAMYAAKRSGEPAQSGD